MKWVMVSNSSSGKHFELWKEGTKLVSLTISTCTKISRIECATEKRLFFIEKKGFLQNRTVIKNEYGILMGELHGETWEADRGFIELDGRKYAYSLDTGEEPGLVIYEELSMKPLVHCQLAATHEDAAAIVKKSKSLHDTRYPNLLMALCWYLLKLSPAEVEIVA